MATSESQIDTERHKSDLYTRPGWVDAIVALEQIEQGKAIGDRGVLWIRVRLQRQLHSLGRFLDAHAGKVLFVALLIIATFCVGLKSSTFHSDIEQLWAEPVVVEDSPPPEVLSTHQMVVQTVGDPDASLLHPSSLLEHLSLIRKATQVTITMYDITWRLKDICQSPSVPNFEVHYIEQMFENVMPCSIVTPLDCFWEGSKLLGPDYPVPIPYGNQVNLNWTNLNPSELVTRIKQKESRFDYHSLEDYFRRAGITSGYQEKPCLNPKDPECPTTAPNNNSTSPVDIGAELTSGCYGFAAKYMHWPEDLIVGGVSKNKTGHIKQAKALHTVIQLMGEHELFEFYSETYKVHHIGWNQEKAALILRAWQKRFAQEVEHLMKNVSALYSFNTFSTATLNRALAEHSQIDFIKLGVVLLIAAFYAWVTHSGLATLCVFILASCTAAGLGVCSLLGLPMNLLSTQVLPFVSVGLSMSHMFLLLATRNKKLAPPELLQRTGPSILTAATRQGAIFLAAAIVPITALRIFCLQCAVLTVFHNAAILLVFPTLIALHIRLKKADVPCFRNETKTIPPINNNIERDHEANLLTSEFSCQQKRSFLNWLINKYLTLFIFKPIMRVCLCITYAGLVVFCIFNGLKVEYDVRLSSFLPKNTQEYRYLEAQNRYFGFYNFYLVTTELEYPLSQPLLHEYHSSLTQVPYVLKDSNGGLNNNDFWLANFRDFLTDLQLEFDRNKLNGCLNDETWFPNSTEKAVLAFKLLAQTGIVEFPVDKGKIFKKKLVDNNGIIDPKAFYNYLSVWNSNDEISYSSSQANLMPKPFQYYSSKTELDCKIPKSQPLIYTQMPFYLKNLKSTNKIIETLRKILSISDSFNVRGLKNYPVGLIFAYFNQFLLLDRLLMVQLVLTVLTTVIVSCVLVHWNKLVCPVINTLLSLLILCFMNINGLTGTMGALHFIVVFRSVMLVMFGYQSSLGSRERRLRMSLEMYIETILKGDIGLLICVGVLAMSNFEFIQLNIFRVLFMSLSTSVINVLVFFPTMLSIIGPKGELQGLEFVDRISTPPPKISQAPPARSNYSKQSRRSAPSKATREPSLTTITEESCNQSIVVEPQVTVEYSSPESSSSGPYTTKVTATANIKVELVTPVYRPKCSKSHRTKHSKRHAQCRCCKNDTDSDSSVSAPEQQDSETEHCTNS